MTKDAFETLGLEPGFDLDPGALAERHRELSRRLHPDRYVGRPASERREALSRAMDVNQAYRTLRDPIERARTILARLGTSAPGDIVGAADPDFLMEIMELREGLRDAARSGDEHQVETLHGQVEERARAVERALSEQFSQALAGRALDREGIEGNLSTLRYFQRFLEEAGAHLDEMP